MLQLILAVLVAEILERIVEAAWAFCWRWYQDYRRGRPSKRDRVVAFAYGLIEKSKATFYEIDEALKVRHADCDKRHSLRQANEIVNRLGL